MAHAIHLHIHQGFRLSRQKMNGLMYWPAVAPATVPLIDRKSTYRRPLVDILGVILLAAVYEQYGLVTDWYPASGAHHMPPESHEVNAELPWPLPSQVKRAIVSEIADGTFPEGSRLPPERVLAERFLVSRKTVRAALAELEEAGRITRHVGRGTFVKELPREVDRPFPHVGVVFLKYTDPRRDPLTTRFFEGFDEVLRESNIVATMYGLTCVKGSDYEVLVRDVLEMRFDAVAMAPHCARGPLDLMAQDTRIFQAGYCLLDAGGSYVAADLAAGLRKAVGHLYDLGHRRISFISAERESHDTSGEVSAKVTAFERVAGEFDIGPSVIWGNAFDRALTGPDRPTAVITSQTGQAKGLLAYASELGVRVPDELSIISFDDGEIGTTTTPQFSGIDVLTKAVGRRGAEVLKDLLEGDVECPVRETFEPELIIRETCAKAPE